MQTPFRNDVDALKTRLATLDEELQTLRSKARELEGVQERLTETEREHADLRREIEARSVRRPAPYLDTLRIASPCTESWEGMIGDDKTRFCARCQKNVHNVSEMTRPEAEAFLESVAGSACVRMYQRTDGTVLTADCPVGARKKRVKRLFLATVGGGLAMAAGALAFWRVEEEVTTMGAIAPVETTSPAVGQTYPQPSSAPAPTPTFATPPDGRQGPMMGKPSYHEPRQPSAPSGAKRR